MKTLPVLRPLLWAATIALVLQACSSPSVEAERQRAEGAKFLRENRDKPGVVTTASGLQYQVLEAGSGVSPKATDRVTVNYRGYLVSGDQFDGGEGVSFPLDKVIAGWTEGLQLMKEGARYRFFIPPELAYGERGAAPVIPPNATLIFEVKLVKVEPP
ncbi:FKBP-type peptidyl-prolyl cis-trans isomerase [Candidatus Methylocalor cossyra]|uniref:Peptidyl-prolyl cis-trans isomerase n=1 Tax=Candidatus Methylocalor cossyra TaxID=3108543 RepID=A0ABM9NIT2_9GAMM